MRRSTINSRPSLGVSSPDSWTPPTTGEAFPNEPVPGALPPSHHLAIVALIVPLLGAGAAFWVESFTHGLMIGGVVVISSSLLVYLDARQLPLRGVNGKKQTAPLLMLIASLLLWVVFFPWSYVRRSRITGPNLSLIAVLIAAIFVGGPFLIDYLVPPGLPRCDSKEVKEVIQQLARQSVKDGQVSKIDGHQQLSFDAARQLRTGQCMLHTWQGKIPLKYIVEWRDKDLRQFQVRTLVELPTCTSPEARQLLEQVVRSSELGQGFQSIEDHQELSSDEQKEERTGVCTLNTTKGKVRLKFIINWQDKAKGMFQVQAMLHDVQG